MYVGTTATAMSINVSDEILHEGEWMTVSKRKSGGEGTTNFWLASASGDRAEITPKSTDLIRVRHYGCDHAGCTTQPADISYVNLTPHTVHVVDVNGDVLAEYLPDGRVARMTTTIVETEHERVLDLDGLQTPPPPRPKLGYIVSFAFAAATAISHMGRNDLYVPHDQVKDQNGAIVGCRELIRVRYQ